MELKPYTPTPKDSLIQEYRGALTPEFCQFIIDKFEQSQNLMDGMTGGGVRKHVKASTDLMIHFEREQDEDWQYIYNYLMENLLQYTARYLETNPFIVVGEGFSSNAAKVRAAQSCFGITNDGLPHIQMQRYIGSEGYFAWHHENEGGTTAKREMFFIYYLNTLNSGATEFKYNKQKVNPETGKLIIAPALWTHKHRGNAPGDDKTKYILTGWIESKDNNISEEFEEDFLL
jgi:hypothetical protein